MDIEQFNYHLPDSLIAQEPPPRRGDSRLLVLESNRRPLRDRLFDDIAGLISPGDLLVFNNSRVIPARLFGAKDTGGRVEILVERLLSDHTCLAQIRASKSPRTGQQINLESGDALQVLGRSDDFFTLKLQGSGSLLQALEAAGHVPLPPYIDRSDTPLDRNRYQTVYAREPGAVAAPTAGLHFTQATLQALKQSGVELAFLTLHVGAGTFQPLRSERIEDHRMHSERYCVEPDLCRKIETTRSEGGRVVSVGTTTLRALESAASSGRLQAGKGETSIFIYPGFTFQVVDRLITNFHLPKSTLLMLVCAFAGTDRVMAAYRHAIDRGYRFYSYGDAMLVDKLGDAEISRS